MTTELATEETLTDDRLDIPRPANDAMILCKEMGERYLWVDALCIIQDDSMDKEWQIARIGSIYSSAVFTIVAACGVDADAGLPGVRLR